MARKQQRRQARKLKRLAKPVTSAPSALQMLALHGLACPEPSARPWPNESM
jgi:hypothetical protein